MRLVFLFVQVSCVYDQFLYVKLFHKNFGPTDTYYKHVEITTTIRYSMYGMYVCMVWYGMYGMHNDLKVGFRRIQARMPCAIIIRIGQGIRG